MPGTGQIYCIVGAGIAGLTLALALAKFGASVVVLERAAELSEFGAGLQLSPNARRVLDGLGLGDAIAQRSFEPEGIDLYPQGLTAPLMTLQLGSAMRQKFGAPYAVMHRADLADMLHRACRRFANIDIVFGVADWSAHADAQGVTVGADGGRTVRCKGLIGADGVHSPTRRHLLGGPDARYFGRVAWRALLPFAEVGTLVALDRVSVLLGHDYHIVCYPLPHRQQLNVAMFSAAPETARGPTPSLENLRDARAAAILARAEQRWSAWPLYTVEAPRWYDGKIGLVGDAAHAMVPFQAQGAAMGIEDAAVLAPLLVETADAAEAFARYEAVRRPRVSRVARQSLDNGRIFHLGGPAAWARDRVIAAQGPRGHLRRLDWLYGYDANVTLAAKTHR